MSNNLRFEGWGTSLAWWANIDYPDDVREYICDLIFSDLKLNIVRYNLGGGTDPLNPQENMRKGALVPCLKSDKDSPFNLQNDKYQIKILDESIKRGVDYVELFCNSPPWWMTLSGKTSGHFKKAHNNMNPVRLDEFTDYLIECIQALEDKYPGKIKSISPFNEPSSPFWTENNGQEGCFWSYDIRRKCIEKLDAIKKTNSTMRTTSISAADSFCSGQEFLWQIFSPRNLIDKVNIHSYNLGMFSRWKIYIDDLDIWRYALRYFNYNKPLWMSEHGLNNGWNDKDSQLNSALQLAKTVLRDLKTLKPQAWIYWQAVEDANPGNWGLIDVPFCKKYCNVANIRVRKIFYALKHFTNTLRRSDTYTLISDKKLKVVNENTNKIGYVILNDSRNELDYFNLSENLNEHNILLDDYEITIHITDYNLNYEEMSLQKCKLDNIHIFPNSITSVILNKKTYQLGKDMTEQINKKSLNIIATSECFF